MPQTRESPPRKLWLSPSEVVAEYGGSVTTWRRLALAGTVKASRLGEVLISFPREAIEAYLAGNVVSGPAPVRNGRRHGKLTGPRASTHSRRKAAL
jgi:hypothetical protein